MKKSLFTLFFVFVFSIFTNAQMSAGFSLGTINYHGDLTKGFVDPKEINIAYGVFVSKRYANPKISLNGQFQMGTISGNDANYLDRQNRGLKFTSPITYIGMTVEYAPFATTAFNFRSLFIPQKNIYFSSGLGLTLFNPKVSGLESKAPDMVAEVSKTMVTIPLNIGYRFDLVPEWSVAIQASYHIPFTDYLDGISAAANPNNKDSYFFFGLSLARKWGDIKEFSKAR